MFSECLMGLPCYLTGPLVLPSMSLFISSCHHLFISKCLAQLTCILWLCSNETWHQRWQRSLKSWQATGQVSVCAQCNNLKCVLSGRLCGYCDGLTLKIQFYIALFYFLKLLKCGRNFNWRSPWKILIWVDYFCLESGIQMLSFVSSTSSKN